MCVILSFRTTKSLNENCPSAAHESILTKTLCQQASQRVKNNLSSLISSSDLQLDTSMSAIAKEITKNGGVVSIHPIRV